MASLASSGHAPPCLSAISGDVGVRLAALFDHEVARWTALDGGLRPPLEHLQRFVMNGGKRLRPAFCYWGYRAAGGQGLPTEVVDAGAAFELLQAFALIHDDVMDGSSTRRGEQTAHLAFADRHRAGRWRGEDRRFGEGVAILLGDLAHVYADRLLRGAPPEARAVWDELRIELNIGQYLDLAGSAEGDRTVALSHRIARYKSGKYTIERPLHLGAALAGRSDLAEALTSFGDPLGEAFQLRDDVLGAFGETEATGKPVGDDLREGKPTLLLAVAHQRGDADQRSIVDLVGDEDLDDEAVARIQQVLVDTGAVTEVEATIAALTEQALGALQAETAAGRVDGDAAAALAEIAVYLATRDR